MGTTGAGVARFTRGSVPDATSHLRRVSLNASHWRRARWLLAAEALATGISGAAGLIRIFLVAPADVGFSVFGIPLTEKLSWVLLGLAVFAAVAAIRHRLALLFSAATSIGALMLVVISAVAAAHHAPSPTGLTAVAILLWAALFCYNFAVGMWLVPDQIAGPAWLPRKRAAGRVKDSKREPG